tara:strand:- start:19865 stop:20764 length:900 start_codon:yes stop_codon:yes gene_type:complete
MPEPQHKNKTNGIGHFYFEGDNIVLGSLKDLESKKDPFLTTLKESRVDYSDIVEIVGLNKSFYVCLTNIDDSIPAQGGGGTPVGREICVARMVKNRRKIYLHRETPLYHCNYDDNGVETMHRVAKEKQSFYRFSKNGYLFAFCYVPTSINEALAVDNAVVCSIEPFTPSPVVLDEATLLGRLNDTIQPIDAKELKQILNGDTDSFLKLTKKELEHVFNDLGTRVLNVIRDSKRAIATYSQKIDMLNRDSSVASPIFQAKPEYSSSDRPKKPRQGMIIFNKETKSFEGYDGQSWKTLKME